MAQIFISYSRVDKSFLDSLYQKLGTMYGHNNVWHDGKMIGSNTQSWWDQILDQIASCDVFIYVLTNESVQSAYCQAEFTEARRLQKQITTVQARDRTKLTDDLETIHYIDMKGGVNDGEALTQLYRSINWAMTNIQRVRPKPLWDSPTPQPNATKDDIRKVGDDDIETDTLQVPEIERRTAQQTRATPPPLPPGGHPDGRRVSGAVVAGLAAVLGVIVLAAAFLLGVFDADTNEDDDPPAVVVEATPEAIEETDSSAIIVNHENNSHQLNTQIPADFSLKTRIDKSDLAQDAFCGVRFRDQDNQYYSVAIGDSGHLYFDESDPVEGWMSGAEHTDDARRPGNVLPGDTFDLEIRAYGDQFEVLVDDEEVIKTSDSENTRFEGNVYFRGPSDADRGACVFSEPQIAELIPEAMIVFGRTVEEFDDPIPDNNDIYLASLWEGQWITKPLLTGEDVYNFPSPSPDGSQIAFVSNRVGENTSEGWNIWLMNTDGSGEPIQITDTDETLRSGIEWNHATWSPDGSQIAFARSVGSYEIYTMSVNPPGVIGEPLTDTSYASAPDWSPNGEFIAYQARQTDCDPIAIWIYNRSTGQSTQVTFPPEQEFTCEDGEIIMVEEDTELVQDFRPSWSADERYIVFQRGRDIYRLELNGDNTPVEAPDNPKRLTTSNLTDWAPSYSPDGSQIAYYHQGRTRIIDADGDDRELLGEISTGDGLGNGHPMWVPMLTEE